jgi:hypothetical protein
MIMLIIKEWYFSKCVYVIVIKKCVNNAKAELVNLFYFYQVILI